MENYNFADFDEIEEGELREEQDATLEQAGLGFNLFYLLISYFVVDNLKGQTTYSTDYCHQVCLGALSSRV